jgi:hypothetical protein
VVSHTVEERVAGPGETYTGTILLRNTTSEEQEVKLYQTDYAFLAGGQTRYASAGSTARSSAAWISVQPAQLVLRPNAEAIVSYTVSVPAAVESSGSYWCMVMVEPIGKGSPTSSLQPGSPDRTRIGLMPIIRYGIQLVTHMPRVGNRTAELADAALLKHDGGARSLRYAVVNTGQQAYRPKLTTEIYDPRGQLAARFENARGLVYPGSSVLQTLELPPLASGNYKILIIADTGDQQLYAAQYRITF